VIFRLFISTEVAIPTELYGMSHVSVLFMLILCLRLYPQFVLCTECYVLLAGSGATVLSEGRNVRGLSKSRCSLGREKFFEIYMMNDVELG